MTEKQVIHAYEFLMYLKARQEGYTNVEVKITRKSDGVIVGNRNIDVNRFNG